MFAPPDSKPASHVAKAEPSAAFTAAPREPAGIGERAVEARAAAPQPRSARAPPFPAAASLSAGPSALRLQRYERLMNRRARGGVVQRVDAKGAQEDDDASGEVPGLSSGLVERIKQGKPRERLVLLKVVYNEVKHRYVQPEIRNKIELVYLAGTTDYLGQFHPKEPPHDADVGGKLEITEAAFDGGPSCIYSTLRHELIHAEQARPHQVKRLELWKQWQAAAPSSAAASSSSLKAEDQFDKIYPFVEAGPGDTYVKEDTHKPGKEDFRGGEKNAGPPHELLPGGGGDRDALLGSAQCRAHRHGARPQLPSEVARPDPEAQG